MSSSAIYKFICPFMCLEIFFSLLKVLFPDLSYQSDEVCCSMILWFRDRDVGVFEGEHRLFHEYVADGCFPHLRRLREWIEFRTMCIYDNRESGLCKDFWLCKSCFTLCSLGGTRHAVGLKILLMERTAYNYDLLVSILHIVDLKTLEETPGWRWQKTLHIYFSNS